MRYTQAVKLWHNWLLQKLPWTKYWYVKEKFVWFLDYADKENYIEIFKGFKTDLWSIPTVLQVFFSPSKYIGYIQHDYLYSKWGQILDRQFNKISYTRREADLILKETLAVEGASKIEQWCIYLWVRIGGWLYFKK